MYSWVKAENINLEVSYIYQFKKAFTCENIFGINSSSDNVNILIHLSLKSSLAKLKDKTLY